ncbi:MAG: phosphatidylserine decarboxylase [Bacteroidetes bacterium]|jgi:phosphatidylserine decarboxylase|nr:phosphatidylserine decarboxylase [Bacteroidota bacterium]PKP33121.1 MAG: phosphatidylserine decarboxylase [Bacteroidetes bacterium HGW-Bacteroidetes-16]
MKKSLHLLIVLCFLVITTVLTSCKRDDSSNTPTYGDKTLELIGIVESNQNIKSLLVKSIDQAKMVNPDKNTNPAQTLEEYYEFVTWAETCMPWTILPGTPYPLLYDKIDQSLDYFYFINDQPLTELEGLGLYHNSLQYVTPYTDWLVSFNKAWGLYLNTPESWKDEYYQMALADDRFGLSNDWYEDPSNWNSFNRFFSRYLKSPDKRPIASPDDKTIVVSPADAEPEGEWQIDINSNVVEKDGVPIKSGTLISVVKLIGEDSQYENEFAEGTLTHTFLNVQDYHRYHFPVGGIIKEVRIINDEEAVGGIITWDAANERYMLNDSIPGWQAIETRGCVIIDTEDFGLVALLPIGMSQVCSVNWETNITVGTRVNKGDMLGYFLFGGSDFVMIFQKDAGFVLETSKTPDNGQSYPHLLMGEKYGVITGLKD